MVQFFRARDEAKQIQFVKRDGVIAHHAVKIETKTETDLLHNV